MSAPLLCGHEFALVSALDDVAHDEDSDDEVEGGFVHGGDCLASDFHVGEVSAFGEQHDADHEKDEESEDFVESVFLEEGGDVVREPDHEDSADDDGGGHDGDGVAEGHGAED